tara:strand:+ start:189 stop:698 length:510 start_codon:yes stop_codon:yes gene_type:complete
MSEQQPHQQFNVLYDEFMVKLKKAIPQEENLWTLHDAFSAGKKINPRMPVEMYINSLHLFADKIFEQDDSFFLTNEKINKELSEHNSNGTFNTLDSIKSFWDTGISDKTKKAIWAYLQNLMILAYSYLGFDVAFDEGLLKNILLTCETLRNKTDEDVQVVEYLKAKIKS